MIRVFWNVTKIYKDSGSRIVSGCTFFFKKSFHIRFLQYCCNEDGFRDQAYVLANTAATWRSARTLRWEKLLVYILRASRQVSPHYFFNASVSLKMSLFVSSVSNSSQMHQRKRKDSCTFAKTCMALQMFMDNYSHQTHSAEETGSASILLPAILWLDPCTGPQRFGKTKNRSLQLEGLLPLFYRIRLAAKFEIINVGITCHHGYKTGFVDICKRSQLPGP